MMIHRRLLQLAGDVLWPIAMCVLLGLAVSATYITQALLVAAALAGLIDGDTGRASLLLVLAVGVVLLRAAVAWVREILTAWAGGRIRARLRDRLVARVAELGPGYLSGARSGAVQATLTDGVQGLDPYYSRYLPQVLITATVPFALVGYLLTVEARSALILAACIALVLTVPRLQDIKLMRHGKRRWQVYMDLAADYLEAMQGMATLRILGAGGRRRDALEQRSLRLYRDTMTELRLSLTESGMTALLIQLGIAAAVVAAASATTGPAGAATMFLVLLVAAECFRPVRDLGKAWHAGYLGITAADGIIELLSAQPAVRDTGAGISRWLAGNPPAITFEDVRFAYPGSPSAALDGFGLTIPAGGTVALVGRSGAGKSTVVALLARHHDVGSGAIRLDGDDVRDLTLASLRSAMAVVSQGAHLFAMSVLDNVRLGAPDATEQDIIESCTRAGAHEFVALLPDGYRTVLDEGGRSLSGGQRQRLALARALVRQAPILVLDEATSHIDGAGQSAVSEMLRSARRGRTCIVIAHRLSTIADVDEVVVLDGGRVVQRGAPAVLAAQPDGPFAALLAAQERRAA